MPLLWIALGLVLLLVGGELLVRGASGLALKMRITPLIVGLTIVSFATSAPELIVSVQASMNGHSDIAIGNVMGSNIANIGLILGSVALAFAIPVTWLAYRNDWIAMVGASGLLWLFILDRNLSSTEGVILVAALIAYLMVKIRENRNQRDAAAEIPEGVAKKKTWLLVVILILSILALRYGAEFLVLGAVRMAIAAGVEERIVSLTIVAFGTSLPELAASMVAAYRGEREIAIGNVIGSNIFNILSVLGISSIITDIPVQSKATLNFDIFWMMAFALLLYPLIILFKKNHIGRLEGLLLLGGYFTYILLLVLGP